ncbi:MAG: hypothetical protein SGI72_09805 [Planctomycetota bacterium]|nr:hypothetical protein [Planctomycetota bacterium]
MRTATMMTSLAVLCMASTATAADVFFLSSTTTPSDPILIATSQTWTANNVYILQSPVYIMPGATLTIDAGTVVASMGFNTTSLLNDPNLEGGTLAITRGAQIFVNGTAAQPVIMTSQRDTATWANGNPKTGVWRESANEWGNLTVMGSAYIAASACKVGVQVPPITATPSATNFAFMEGLTPASVSDTKTRYGGGNDNDDSGSITYLSIRYGGKVVGLANELNGLSLGGIGRNTEISHLEIMNNVDDGIEIWGGTVNLDHFNIWNIGDDSLDVDQGWRGKAQFGLLVQGYSVNAAQGSGVGDNLIEMDGAEDSDQQPVTTSTIYNCTLIGQPVSGAGDHAMAFRDNARVQLRNCIFMDIGDRLVSPDNSDADNPCPGSGYGFNGTLSYVNTWTTPFTATSTVNPFATPAEIAAAYTVQTSGNLLEVKDSVMVPATFSGTTNYSQATTVGVFALANNNVGVAPSPLSTGPAIQSIQRGAPVVRGGLTMRPVTRLDPRPANDALTSVSSANPAEGFWATANYRGAFAPTVEPWVIGWTASYAFGLTPDIETTNYFCVGDGSATACPCGNSGLPGNGCASSAFAAGGHLVALGDPSISGDTLTLTASNIPGPALFIQSTGLAGSPIAFGDGQLCAAVGINRLGVVFPSTSAATYPGGLTPGPISIVGSNIAGGVRHYQAWYRSLPSLCGAGNYALTQGLTLTWQP